MDLFLRSPLVVPDANRLREESCTLAATTSGRCSSPTPTLDCFASSTPRKLEEQ